MSSNVIIIPPSESKPDTLRVAAYCRVSFASDHQPHSYAAQIRKYTEEIGHREGWELVEKNIPTAEGIRGWSRQVIQNILTSEKYIGDGLRQKTYPTGPIGNKKVVKNNGELPMYYAKDNHPAIIPRDIYYRVKEEMSRRASKRKVMQKTGKTEQGKYSAKYTPLLHWTRFGCIVPSLPR